MASARAWNTSKAAYFWEGKPQGTRRPTSRRTKDAAYRAAVGVDDNGASVSLTRKDVSTYAHMFGCWETLHIDQARAWRPQATKGPQDRAEADRSGREPCPIMSRKRRDHPQGAKRLQRSGRTRPSAISISARSKAESWWWCIQRASRTRCMRMRWIIRRRRFEGRALRDASSKKAELRLYRPNKVAHHIYSVSK